MADPADGLTDARQWLRRAATLVNREPELQRRTGLALAAGVAVGPILNVLDYGLALGVVLRGVGWGLLIGAFFVFLIVNNRMEAVFPDHGDDETDEQEPDDSLRSRYVAGEIDYETFQHRLDERLAQPVDADGAATAEPDPADAVALLRARYARGEIDEATYRDRLETLQETADDTAETDSDASDAATGSNATTPDAAGATDGSTTGPTPTTREPERND